MLPLKAYDDYITAPMYANRRRGPRVAFGGVAEVSAIDLPKYIIAAATNLSRFGCFVKTTTSFFAGCKVNVRITYSGTEFAAPGEVVYALPENDIGIVFGAISPKGQTLLERWLSEPEQVDFEGISAQEAVRIRMAFLDDFPVNFAVYISHGLHP